MDRNLLLRFLGCDAARLEALIAEGLPADSDRDMIAAWLEKSGLANRKEFKGNVPTLADVAKVFGVSLNTVKKDWRPSGMPGRPGAWNLAEIFHWRQLSQRFAPDQAAVMGAAGNGDTSNHGDLQRRLAADVRVREAEAARKERENKMAEGNTIERDVAERHIAALIISVRDVFRELPRKLMPRFPKKQAPDLTREVEREVNAILEMLANWQLPQEYESDEAEGTA